MLDSIFGSRASEGCEALRKVYLDMEDRSGHYVAVVGGRVAGILELATRETMERDRRAVVALLQELGPFRGTRELLALSRLDERIGEDDCRITQLAVEHKLRGRGLGGLLLVHSENVARALAKDRLTLHVHRDNEMARSLYLSRGFQTVPVERDDAEKRGQSEDWIHLAKRL